MKVHFVFEWYSFWIGWRYDPLRSWLTIAYMPMVSIVLRFPQRRYWLVSVSDPSKIVGSSDKEDLEFYELSEKATGHLYWAKNGQIEPWFGVDHHNHCKGVCGYGITPGNDYYYK